MIIDYIKTIFPQPFFSHFWARFPGASHRQAPRGAAPAAARAESAHAAGTVPCRFFWAGNLWEMAGTLGKLMGN